MPCKTTYTAKITPNLLILLSTRTKIRTPSIEVHSRKMKSIMEQLNIDHRPHDTRHTCISLLTMAGVDDRIIKKIVGHSGKTVTEMVYTHFEIAPLLEAINMI